VAKISNLVNLLFNLCVHKSTIFVLLSMSDSASAELVVNYGYLSDARGSEIFVN
jgi:hypothetical protein